jgi:hypothetical protein
MAAGQPGRWPEHDTIALLCTAATGTSEAIFRFPMVAQQIKKSESGWIRKDRAATLQPDFQ